MAMLWIIRKILLFSVVVWFIGSISPVISIGRAGDSDASGIKNVIVIVLDALRADHLGIYGYPRTTSPNIDKIAGKGLLFKWPIVQAGWTKPSVTSYFASLYPAIHQTLTNEDTFPPNPLTMAEVFRANGYYCYGFIHNVNISPELGFGRGFHIYRGMSDREIIKSFWLAFSGRL